MTNGHISRFISALFHLLSAQRVSVYCSRRPRFTMRTRRRPARDVLRAAAGESWSSHHCNARPSWSPRHATYSRFGSRGSAVSFSISSPRSSNDATRWRGSQPMPRPSRCARIFARIVRHGERMPGRRRRHRRARLRAKNPRPTMPRCFEICSRFSGVWAPASGWRGATANTHSTTPSSNHARPGIAGGSLVAPTIKSARPSRSASHVPHSALRA